MHLTRVAPLAIGNGRATSRGESGADTNPPNGREVVTDVGAIVETDREDRIHEAKMEEAGMNRDRVATADTTNHADKGRPERSNPDHVRAAPERSDPNHMRAASERSDPDHVRTAPTLSAQCSDNE